MGKPIFTEGIGVIVNPDRLALQDLERLTRCLPTTMAGDDRQRFLTSTSSAVDLWEKCLSDDPLAHSEIVGRIEKLELAAKALQRAIENLEGDTFNFMDPHFGYLIHGTAPAFKLPENLRSEKVKLKSVLDGAWTTCHSLRVTGEHARTQIRVNRSIKPSAQMASALARDVIGGYAGAFAALPPTGKGSWFVEYMGTLGDVLGLDTKFGYSMLTTAASNVHVI